MKTLTEYVHDYVNDYIVEAFRINKDTKIKHEYKYCPKTKKELRDLIKKLLDKRGGDADLNDIDVSKINNMTYLFSGLDIHNIDISEWNVSNVENMYCMFYGCIHFNSDLSSWDVSNVDDMEYMFYACEKFNSDLSKWNVSNVEEMGEMFYRCNSLQNIPSWYKK